MTFTLEPKDAIVEFETSHMLRCAAQSESAEEYHNAIHVHVCQSLHYYRLPAAFKLDITAFEMVHLWSF